MKSAPMARASSFHPFAMLLEETGGDSAKILSSVGINPIFSGTQAPRDDAVPCRTILEFLGLATKTSGIENFGLEAGSRTSVHSIGVLGTVLGGSLTVYELIHKLADLLPHLNFGSHSWFEPGREPGSLRFCHRQEIETEHAHIDAFAIQVFIDAVRIGAGAEWRPRWAALTSDSGNLEDREMFADAEVIREVQHLAFEIPRAVLCLELPDPYSLESQNAESDLIESAPPTELSEALVAAVRSGFGARIPSVEEASDIAGMSTRTLQRRLQSSGQSYHEIVERTRIREALRLLGDPTRSIADIAQHLKYANHANFTHAFRRWAGVPPSEHRLVKQETAEYGGD